MTNLVSLIDRIAGPIQINTKNMEELCSCVGISMPTQFSGISLI